MDRKFVIGEYVHYNSKGIEFDTGKVVDIKLNEHGDVIYFVKFGEDYYSWLTEKYLKKL